MTTFRGAAFWAADRLKGGPVRAHMNDIASLMEDRDGGERRRRLLAAQLRHATARVPFYRELCGATELNDFPVVNKAVIRENADQAVASGFDRDRLHVASTSGSTGTPFRVYQDPRKRRRTNAETIYWGALAGYELGLPLYHLKVWSERNRIGHLDQVLRNIVPVDVTGMGRQELLELFVEPARRGSKISVISYSSTLEDIARELESKTIKWPRLTVASMIGQSESLPREVRASLAQSLGCEPVARYGLEELGIVGQQLRNGEDDYLVNRATQVVEVLREDSDDPAPPGALGRIVVTELFNHAQPMIRYDTGDLGAFALTIDGEVDERRLARVEGRKLDRVFDADDRPLSSMVMYKIWWRYPEINQYQLVQRGRGDYVLKLNVPESFDRAEELIRDFRGVVGQAAAVAIELTDDSFVLSSGKRKSVVSEYLPEHTT